MTNTEKTVDLGLEHFIWKSHYEREKKFFCIRSDFVPSLKAECVTGKFYSKHDVMRREDVDQSYVRMIEEECAKGPKDRNDQPLTEAQRYGWYAEPLVPYTPALNYPRKYCSITWIAQQIFQSTRNMPKDPPFTGVPFKT